MATSDSSTQLPIQPPQAAPPPPKKSSPPPPPELAETREYNADISPPEAAAPPPRTSARPTGEIETPPAANEAHYSGEVEMAEPADEPLYEYRPPLVKRWLIYFSSSWLVSLVVHLVLLLALALLVMPEEVKKNVVEVVSHLFDKEEEEILTVELEENLEAASELTSAVFSSSPAEGLPGGAIGSITAPEMDQKMVEHLAASASDVAINAPALYIPSPKALLEAVPEGTLGDPRAVVDNYQQALDRITQEIVWMLDKNKVLVVWCFDQSGSMKDDQEEIRGRIEKIYQELGLTSVAAGDNLTTAVTSYGQGFAVHTQKPTHDRNLIRSAIGEVPVDESGKEMMCQAVGASIAQFSDYARKARRQMALILVTDESGERDNNARFLEQAIAEAQSARCRVYVLGREACFGYPYVHVRWVHPQTNRPHWLAIDRGPETGFVEQLQTNGFHRRYDAFASGFGPYEQTRIARETGGIFFMLPGLESSIVRGDDRKYELEAMRPYRPDLRARVEVLQDRDKFPLRTLLWSVVYDLDPYNEEARKIIEMRSAFSIDRQQFFEQARTEQQKATIYLNYLANVQAKLESKDAIRLREMEADPRWQANYDLIYAQVVAYQARIYEYGAYLETALRNPPVAPATRPPDLKLVHFDIGTRTEIIAPQVSQPYIDKASALFQLVIENHEGTPWAQRARWELGRGFGVHLVPDYQPPYRSVSNPMPIPKL